MNNPRPTSPRPWPTRLLLGLSAMTALLSAVPARAGGPEQLYEPGPGAGRWNIEYNGQQGKSSDAERPHTLEAFHGVTDRVALGFELESEVERGKLTLDEFGVGAIFNLADEQAPVEVSVLVQAGITPDGEFPQLETRLIAERSSGAWHALGNVTVRRVNADERGTSLGYAVLLERSIGDDVRLGAELSGQLARLGGFAGEFERGSYFGPSHSAGWEIGDDRELELGVKYLRRLDRGDQYRHTVRMVASLKL